jgi:hypothetical protein
LCAELEVGLALYAILVFAGLTDPSLQAKPHWAYSIANGKATNGKQYNENDTENQAPISIESEILIPFHLFCSG